MFQIQQHHGSQNLDGHRAAKGMEDGLTLESIVFELSTAREPQAQKHDHAALHHFARLVGAQDIFVIAQPLHFSDWKIVYAGTQCVQAGVNTESLAMLWMASGLSICWAQLPNNQGGSTLLVAQFRGTDGSLFIAALLFDLHTADEQVLAEVVFNKAGALLCSILESSLQAEHLQNKTQGLYSALDCVDAGVVLLNAHGSVVHENGIAERILDQGAGLRRCGQSVTATDMTDAVRFRMAIEYVNSPDILGKATAPLLALKRGKNQRPLLACVVPANVHDNRNDSVSLIIFLYDPAREIVHLLRSACHLYRLSPVETELSCRLACGESIADAAAALRIKELTARGYLKQIFVKTGVNRQAALVQLLLSSTPHLGTNLELTVI